MIVELYDSAEYALPAMSDSRPSGVGIQYKMNGDNSAAATWTFDVAPDFYYDVAATWTAASNRATDAPFTISDGITSWTVDANQEAPPTTSSTTARIGSDWGP